MKCGVCVNGYRNNWEKCVIWVYKVMAKEHGVVISLNDYHRKIREWENRLTNFEFLIGYHLVANNSI